MIPAEKQRVFGLDILRAVAILAVLIGHTWPAKTGHRWAGVLALLGVELFFVLSGFLIGGILLRLSEQRRLHTLADVFAFWRRRWFRTLPNYYLFLALHLVWRTWVLGFPDQAMLNWEYFFFVQNVTHPPAFFFPETWSLAVEEWFYLLFPLVLLAASRLTRKPWHAWVGAIALFLIVPTLLRLWPVLETPSPQNLTQLDAFRRMWESIPRKIVVFRLDVVMYGVVGAVLAAWTPGLWKGLVRLWPLGLILTAACVASLAVQWPLDAGKPWHGFLLWPLICVAFALLLPLFSQIPRMWGVIGRAISWIAKVSYALYLCHGLVLLALAKWFGPKSAYPLPRHTLEWCIAVWILAFLIAGIVYRWFEKPFMDLRDRFEPLSPSPVLPSPPGREMTSKI